MTTTKITPSGQTGTRRIDKLKLHLKEQLMDCVRVPVYGTNAEGKRDVILYDIFYGGVFHGSRRTLRECDHYHYYLLTGKIHPDLVIDVEIHKRSDIGYCKCDTSVNCAYSNSALTGFMCPYKLGQLAKKLQERISDAKL